MRIAVVGSGISGLASAWLLEREHEVVLFEADDRLGGHTDTHDVEVDGQRLAVDTGFIVFNPENYPLLSRFFAELGVESQPTTMSFSVHNEASGLEYNAGSLGGLFCQPRNLLSPRFLRMLADIFRFYREAPALLDLSDDGPSLSEYLARNNYSDAFRDEHLIPMASALWSSPHTRIVDFPAKYLAAFMANHAMLKVSGRPQWCVVRGGSCSYVLALRDRWSVQERLGCAVTSIARDINGVTVATAADSERFDHVVLACHSDQALALLADANLREREILGAIEWQENDTVLHTDARLLPRNRKAWAAWNARISAEPDDACTVSYCMNLLQSLESTQPLVVSLNQTRHIDPARILRRRRYQHPVYTQATVSAQRRRHEIQGYRRTSFAGAWWGHGFHEDGMRSAVDVAANLQVKWP